jgi:tellurite resistance protein TerC
MILPWAGFIAFVLLLLALDLGVFNKKAHAPSIKEALGFAAFTVALALGFAGFVYVAYQSHWQGLGTAADAVDHQVNGGRLAAVKFLTGYVIELSLSMDNVFMIALIFQHVKVPPTLQHRVLFWGILGALAMRGAMIGAGAALVARYHWILLLFGAFLVFTAVKMLLARDKEKTPNDAFIVRWLNKHFRVTKEFHGTKFQIVQKGKRYFTPLVVALVLVESTDLLFAVDSIPAIFAITTDAFLVFTSNVFAILCLRSLYFGLAGMIQRFKYLNASLAVVLGFVGVKMLLGDRMRDALGANANLWTLAVISLILAAGAVASMVSDAKATKRG